MTEQTLPSRKRLGKKNCYSETVSRKDLYRFYSNHYGTPKKGGCALKVYSAVIDEFNRHIAECLIRGDKILLPKELGFIQVIKRKQKFVFYNNKVVSSFLLIDWNRTWKYWETNEKAAKERKLLYYTNEHSDSYRYKFFWSGYSSRVSGIKYFSFKPSRLLSRKLAEYVLDEETLKNYTENAKW